MLLAAGAAGADTVVLEAVERGTFRSGWEHELGPDAAYTAGRSSQGEERAVFVFDVSALAGTARGATLRIWSPAGGLASPDASERVVVHGVSADPAKLVWQPVSPFVRPGFATFWDLGTGRELGAARVGRAAGWVEIPLDAGFLRVLDRTATRVALGLRVGSLRNRSPERPVLEERVFVGGLPGERPPRPELVIETDPLGAPGPPRTLHVDARRGSARGQGSERDPFGTLAAALDLATHGDTVAVAPGRYAEGLVMKHGVGVRGAGADRTLLEIAAGSPSVRCAEAELSGVFVFRTQPFFSGEAVDCTNGASPTLVENQILAPELGVVLLEGSRAVLLGNRIRGGVEGVDSSPTIVGNDIDGRLFGIALSFPEPGATVPFFVERNHIAGDVWIQCHAPPGNRIAGNHFVRSFPGDVLAPTGAIYFIGRGDLGTIASNTFFGTSGIALGARPGPFFVPECEGAKSATIVNNILAFGDSGIFLAASSTAELAHNDVFGNRVAFSGAVTDFVGVADPTGVDGNLSADPLFAGDGFSDVGLAADSPAVDAGANALVVSFADLSGGPRVVDATASGTPTVDIGAEEREPGDPAYQEVRIAVESRERSGRLLFFAGLEPARTLRVAVLSDEAFDAPGELDPSSLAIGEAGPLERRGEPACRVRDVDADGRADLSCLFPFTALDALPRFVEKRVCVTGATTGGPAIRGCETVGRVHLPRRELRP